jgi:hypothetical protein
VQEVAFPSGLKVNIAYGGPVRDRASWLGEKKTFLVPAMLALRPYAKPPATAGSLSAKQSGSKPTKSRDRKGMGGPKHKYPGSFIQEVFAARKRDERDAAKAKRRIPAWAQWLWDFCKDRIDTAEMFPPQFKGEPWEERAERFKRAAKKRLKNPGN